MTTGVTRMSSKVWGREAGKRGNMTKWEDIKRLRLVCHECEGAMSVPLRVVKPKWDTMPSKCPFCSAVIKDWSNFVSSWQTISQILVEPGLNFDVFVESEGDELES